MELEAKGCHHTRRPFMESARAIDPTALQRAASINHWQKLNKAILFFLILLKTKRRSLLPQSPEYKRQHLNTFTAHVLHLIMLIHLSRLL